MSRRSGISLAAVVLGLACIVTLSSDAFARPGRGVGGVGGPGVGVGRPGVGVHRHPVARGAAVGVAVGAGAAYARQRCGYYPYGPCY
jgi:hypothetical protein